MSNYYTDQNSDRILDAATDAADLITDALKGDRFYVDVDALTAFLCDQMVINYPDGPR